MNININIKKLIIEKPLKLDCGKVINNFPLAYETYGTLNSKKDNAILVCHALTGDQFVSGLNPITKKDGWWSYAVGPNKSIDTNKYFIIWPQSNFRDLLIIIVFIFSSIFISKA